MRQLVVCERVCVTARWCIIRSLSIMTDIVEHLSAEGVSRSKQMCHAALRDYIHIALCLVPIYVQDYGKTIVTSCCRHFTLSVNAI